MALVLTLIKHFLLPSVNTMSYQALCLFYRSLYKEMEYIQWLKKPYFPKKRFYDKIYTFHIHIIKVLQLFESIMLGNTKCSSLPLAD